MTATIYADLLYLTSYTVFLYWLVTITTVVLVNRRRRRLPFYCSPVMGLRPQSVRGSVALRAENYLRALDPNAKRDQLSYLPEVAREISVTLRRLPPPANPEQLVIHIEPDGAPTEEARNIQRLIHHLKAMPTSQVAS